MLKRWMDRLTASKFDGELSVRSKPHSAAGREIPDPVPLAPPVGWKKQPSLAEQIREMVRSEKLAQEAAAAGYETFEEADDFDIPDDPVDPTTPYERTFEGLSARELRQREAEAARRAALDSPDDAARPGSENLGPKGRRKPKTAVPAEPDDPEGRQADLED